MISVVTGPRMQVFLKMIHYFINTNVILEEYVLQVGNMFCN